jgi:hypothetical protein
VTGYAERAERLRQLVVLSLERERLGEEVRALGGRIEQLETWGREARAPLPAAKELKAVGRPSKSLRDAATLKRSAARALEDFQENPQGIRRPDLVAVNVFWREAPKQLATLEAGIYSEWRDYVNASMPEYQPDVVRVLAGDNAPAVLAEVAQFARRAAVAAGRLPVDDAEARAVRDLAREARAVMEQFDLEALPSEVRAFIEAALANAATLDLLTPVVQVWLRERGIAKSVRLSFAPAR